MGCNLRISAEINRQAEDCNAVVMTFKGDPCPMSAKCVLIG